jgi:hypothetical protein
MVETAAMRIAAVSVSLPVGGDAGKRADGRRKLSVPGDCRHSRGFPRYPFDSYFCLICVLRILLCQLVKLRKHGILHPLVGV